MADNRPADCRNRLYDENEAYPKSGCDHCCNGGLMGCPYEVGTKPNNIPDTDGIEMPNKMPDMNRVNDWLVELWESHDLTLHRCDGTVDSNKRELLQAIRTDVGGMRRELKRLRGKKLDRKLPVSPTSLSNSIEALLGIENPTPRIPNAARQLLEQSLRLVKAYEDRK